MTARDEDNLAGETRPDDRLRALVARLAGAIAPQEPASPSGTSPGDGALDAQELRRLLAQINEQLDVLAREHEGLVEEVIRGYEQLNLVFDVTRSVAGLSSQVEIRSLLLTRLREILAAEVLYYLPAPSDGKPGEPLVFARDPATPAGAAAQPTPCDESTYRQLTELFGRELALLEHDGRVLAIDQPAGSGFGPAILGPLSEGEQSPSKVIALRGPADPAFVSGDMLLMESILTYGGHILRNVRLGERIRRMSLSAIRALVTAIDKKDHYTRGHSERVAALAKLIGQKLGLSREQLQDLEWTGLLHDVGKIGISEAVLNKPGRLSDAEFEHIKQHPVMSWEVLSPIEGFGAVLAGVKHHHENYDGTGYPDGLAGQAIPLFARIVRVADVFDALTSTRSYRKAFSATDAARILREEAGSSLDPAIVDCFLRALAEQGALPEDRADLEADRSAGRDEPAPQGARGQAPGQGASLVGTVSSAKEPT